MGVSYCATCDGFFFRRQNRRGRGRRRTRSKPRKAARLARWSTGARSR